MSQNTSHNCLHCVKNPTYLGLKPRLPIFWAENSSTRIIEVSQSKVTETVLNKIELLSVKNTQYSQ